MKLKSICFILISIFLFWSKSYCQDASLNKNTLFATPEGFSKQTELNRLAMAKTNNLKIAVLPKELNKLSYTYQNVLISLSSSDKPQKVDLEKLKKGIDELSKGISTYNSKIVVVNEVKALLVDNTNGEKITIFATNANGSELVNGLVEFNKNNRKEALSSVQAVLKNIHFKN